jgi:alpha-glucosidase
MLRSLQIAAAFACVSFAAPVRAKVAALPSGIEVSRGDAAIRVEALTDSILRVRAAPGHRWSEDSSWAVPAAVRAERVPVRASAEGFSTGALAVHVDPTRLALTVTDLAGRTLIADAAEPVRFDGPRFTLSKALPLGVHIYGLGDKTGNFDRRGESFVDWNTDAWGFQRDTDPIYKSIPFYIAAGGPGGAYGLFLDNSWRICFDLFKI